jgi:hypothetical protein
MKLFSCGLMAVLLIAAPSPAQAQPEFIKEKAETLVRKVGVRVNLGFRNPIDSDVTKGRTIGVTVGFGPGSRTGWRFPVALTRFSEYLHSPSGERFGSLTATAIVGGIGYSWHFGRLVTGAALETGYAFMSERTEGDLQHAFQTPGDVALDVDNSLLLRPHVKVEYFITPKVSVRTSADYVLARPGVTVTTPTERITGRWDATNIHANVGVSFYPFRK